MKQISITLLILFAGVLMAAEPINPLTMANGKNIADKSDWVKQRLYLLSILEEHAYGPTPKTKVKITSKEIENADVFDGKAVRRQVILTIRNGDKELSVNLLIHLPKSNQPVPIFLGLNFLGNHTTGKDPAIILKKSYTIKKDKTIMTEKGRGISARRWPAEELIKRGYGLITIHCSDFDPDFHDGFKNGVHGLLETSDTLSTIGAWTWGLSRVMDYLETDKTIDHKRVAVIGHSRLGKTALWTGASDDRFALVISNNSGCGGAAYSRRKKGETLAVMNKSFPHWFNKKYKVYSDKEDQMPFDQHMLIAAIAPRPVYVASASKDLWADPTGEHYSAYHASKVYEFLGKKVDLKSQFPGIEKPVKKGHVGYHMRNGKHDLLIYDWNNYMDFADQFLKYSSN